MKDCESRWDVIVRQIKIGALRTLEWRLQPVEPGIERHRLKPLLQKII
jgi:hypothetical protein